MKKNIITAISLCLLLGTACRKEHSTEGQAYTSLNDFFQQNQAPSQQFSFNNSDGAVIQTKGGAKIHFPVNAFAGSGKVNIDLKEAFSPADMILNNMPAMSDKGPLQSGGEFYIGATMDGQEAKLASGKQIQVDLPNPGIKMDSMRVFTGTVSQDSSNPSRTNLTWAVDNGSGSLVTYSSITQGDTTFSMFASSVRWVNCDAYIGGPQVFYSADASNSPSFSNTRVFAHYSGRNSVIELHPDNYQQTFFNTMVQTYVTIIGVCVKDGQLMASIETQYPESGQVCEMHFQPISASDLKTRLSQLY